MTSPIRLLIVDDHLVVRAGLRTLLAAEPEIEIVGEASDGAEALAEMRRLAPDVILMDLTMPRMDGITAIEQIRACQSAARILVLTSFEADDKVFPAIRAGALGYTLKDFGPAELLHSIKRVHRGELSLHPAIARKVLHELAHPPRRPPTDEPLTEREIVVLRLIAQGQSNQEIAVALGIGAATVGKHVSHILAKLHLASRTQAALYAVREGLA
ncbi:MAG TPA: response regulator transcription factor [Kouleothrix sp.]|uniref:response regulator n=1 Tax=Kouleothrix sp. TaxID=2779161 RepID=UPI002BC7ADA4|nr:response regulator transcription factor [Kouleothrix sp.]